MLQSPFFVSKWFLSPSVVPMLTNTFLFVVPHFLQSPKGLLGVPCIISHTPPFLSIPIAPRTPAASSLADYNSLLTNSLLLSPSPIHCCHRNLPKTPCNQAKPLIKNLHYLFITTRIKSKCLSFLLLSGFNPHFW